MTTMVLWCRVMWLFTADSCNRRPGDVGKSQPSYTNGKTFQRLSVSTEVSICYIRRVIVAAAFTSVILFCFVAGSGG